MTGITLIYSNMVVDIEWVRVHWVARIHGTTLTDVDLERLKSRIRNHGCYPGELR